MEPPPPVSRCSEAVAAAALEHLRGVEKQVQNEGLVFDKGTVQHLEEAVKAIKELEEERRRILELLEEETIKNCNLRVRVKGIPAIVMKEFEELVAAARRSRFHKITEIEASVQEVVTATEHAQFKQQLHEERNLVLCEEQKECGGKHEEAVDLLNQQMAAKNSFCIQMNELRNLQEDEEEESTWQINAIEELEKKMAEEVSVFEEQQKLLESQIAELQRQLQAQRLLTAQKRQEYEALLPILQDLHEQVKEKYQTVENLRQELTDLLEKIRNLVLEYEQKKAEKEKILQQQAALRNKMANMDQYFHETKESLLQQLAEADEELESTTRTNKKLRKENNLLKSQFEALLEEERDFSSRRNQLAKEFERLSNEVTEKLDRLTKRLVEIQNLEEEHEKMEDMLNTAESSYMREIGSLELTLQREGDRSKLLQDQLDEILEMFKNLQAKHSEFMIRTKEKTENGERTLLNLMKQNDMLKKEMTRSVEYIKILSDKLSKKSAWFKKFDDNITDELKKLEGEYNSKLKLLEEKEKKLSMDLPFSQNLQAKLQETTVAYRDQKEIYTELYEEESTLSKSIDRSLKEIARLKRLKNHLKGEIDTHRKTAMQQLSTFSESVKFLERDNYEFNRKLYILDAENGRFREAIAYLRAEISTLEREEDAYRLKRQQAQEETRAVHNLFDNKWSQDKQLWKVFLMVERKALKALEEQIRWFNERNETVNYVSDGLQLNYEGVASLIERKPSTEEDFPDLPSITA
ncbi:coiled-coil domain-containing protein 175 [Paroedura picta]|uniref:coiled-coil domain-containing protein 175 n=1 Tax=Paroedura picta TaxID=143630 RepID=UPI00405784EE